MEKKFALFISTTFGTGFIPGCVGRLRKKPYRGGEGSGLIAALLAGLVSCYLLIEGYSFYFPLAAGALTLVAGLWASRETSSVIYMRRGAKSPNGVKASRELSIINVGSFGGVLIACAAAFDTAPIPFGFKTFILGLSVVLFCFWSLVKPGFIRWMTEGDDESAKMFYEKIVIGCTIAISGVIIKELLKATMFK